MASTADELGAIIPNAQITFSCVSEFAGIVNPSFGGSVPFREVSDAENVAILGGLLSTVGMTCADALRCERVTEESGFGHKMTMEVFIIVVP